MERILGPLGCGAVVVAAAGAFIGVDCTACFGSAAGVVAGVVVVAAVVAAGLRSWAGLFAGALEKMGFIFLAGLRPADGSSSLESCATCMSVSSTSSRLLLAVR